VSGRGHANGHRYGTAHKKERARWTPKVRAGKVDRWRCGKRIEPGEPWDLGHDDDNPKRYRGPEHRRCNRATLPRMLAKARAEAEAHDCREEFDPERCSECRRRDPNPGNAVNCWSRHWTGPFNPRCPNCRRTGEPCEAAQRFMAQEAA
jgi:hypothetical protein